MLEAAARDLQIALEGSYLVGDKLSDIGAAGRAGLTSILVTTGYGYAHWQAALQAPDAVQPDWIAENFYEAVQWILQSEYESCPDAAPPGLQPAPGPSGWRYKWISLPLLTARKKVWRRQGKTIVFAHGVFDLIHAGHVHYLQAARERGDILIVGINDDSSAHSLRGAGRPVVPVEERVEILSSFACIDYIIVSREAGPDRILERLRPDFYVKGMGYTYGMVAQRETLDSSGVQVRVDLPARDHTSSEIIQKIRTDFKK